MIFARDNLDTLELLSTPPCTYVPTAELQSYWAHSLILTLSITLIGDALVDHNRIEDALVTLRRWIVLDPANPEAYLKLANTLNQDEKYEQALGYYNRAVEHLPKTVTDPNATLPTDEEAQEEIIDYAQLYHTILHNISVTYLKLGNQVESDKYYAEAEKLLGRFPPLMERIESGEVETIGTPMEETFSKEVEHLEKQESKEGKPTQQQKRMLSLFFLLKSIHNQEFFGEYDLG